MEKQNPHGRGKQDDTLIDRAENRDQDEDQSDEPQGKAHGALKGTDTPATTDLSYAERERGKRTTM